jgi:parallel beta-helix repeat protein
MNVRPFACTIAALSLVALHAGARADSDKDWDRDRDRDKDRTTTVDCAAGETIAKALTRGDERKSLTILIKGSCSEHVVINRSDIKLSAAAPGATISGPDATIDVIRVTGSRVTIDGITVTGGRNGVTADGAPGLIVQNAFVQNTGRNGITYAHGASGVVDTTLVTSNARDGVAIDAASGTVINSQIGQNGRMGVGVFNGGSARIGVDNFNNAVDTGNIISANASNGIHIVFGSSALIAMNQVIGNGTSTDSTVLKNGINLGSASADLIGGNTVSGNTGQGVVLVRSTATFGDPLFGITTVNTVSGNGNSAAQGGVFAFLGSSLTIRDAVITGNVGFGVGLQLNSSAQIASTTIRNNVGVGLGTGDGIRLIFGSSLLAATPAGSITGNTGFGLNCTDGESSFSNQFSALGIGPNGLGGIATACTGF